MDTTNRLARMDDAIADALEELRVAVEEARGIYSDTLDYDDEGYLKPGSGWGEMGDLGHRLDVIRMALASTVPESIRAACKGAQEDLDHWSDLADAASY